jgi:Tfp pilus assembly protein PilX
MKFKLRDSQGITLVVVLMVMAILLSVIGAGLLFSGINTKITANYQTGNKAFYAADMGISDAITRIGPDPSVVASVPVTAVPGASELTYRSGHRADTSPQPFVYLRTTQQPGFSLGSGTGYNTSGYGFNEYQLNVTGSYTTAWGTELAAREIEAIAAYGPVAR